MKNCMSTSLFYVNVTDLDLYLTIAEKGRRVKQQTTNNYTQNLLRKTGIKI